MEVLNNFTSNFELRPLCPEYNPSVHSVVNVCRACFESAGGLVNSTIHKIWTFVGNISYEEASSNCLRGSQIGSGAIQLFWTIQNLQFQPIANRGHGQDLVKGDEFLPTMSWIEILELHLPKWR
jgi:hypothetical protein